MGIGSCLEHSLSARPECQRWLKEVEAWKERQKAQEDARHRAAEEDTRRATTPADIKLPVVQLRAPNKVVTSAGGFRITGLVGDDGSPPRLTVNGIRQPLFQPKGDDPEIATHTLAFDVSIPADQPGEKRIVLEACDAAQNCVAEQVVVRVVGSGIPPTASATPYVETKANLMRDRDAGLARIEAEEANDPIPFPRETMCNTPSAEGLSMCADWQRRLAAWKKRQAARDDAKRKLATAPVPGTSVETEREAAELHRLAQEREQREDEAKRVAEALKQRSAELEKEKQEAERLRRERDEARRKRAQAEAERKATEERARKLAEERSRAEAQRRAEEEAARKLDEERAREERLAAQQQKSEADQQLEALVKRLQESNLLAQPRDSGLPVIRTTVAKRIEVGDRVRVAGLVGDESGPPRLNVNGEPKVLFRLEGGQQPIAKHTLSFGIDVDTSIVGTRTYVLEACDAAQNCVGERLALNVVAANRPSLAARNFALIIGNNRHRDLPDLQTAVADAQAVAEVLTSRYAFRNENVKLLLNSDRVTMLRSLSGLRKQLQPEDRLLIYYAGHGQIDEVTEEGFWQPVDAVPGEEYSWIANSDVRRQLRGMPAKHVLVVADSCFSGSLTRNLDIRTGIPKDRFYTQIDATVSRKVISSGGTEPVADAGSGGHSVFAYYLLKALRENDSPYLASFELFNKLVRAVTNNSNQKPQYGTVAEAGDEGAGDFTFILKQGG
jgi:hypothetical protein